MQNSLGALLYLLEIAPTFRSGQGPLAPIASLITIATAVLVVFADIDLNADSLKVRFISFCFLINFLEF